MRPAIGIIKKFGARRRMRFGHNKIVKRKALKPLRKKGMAKGGSKFGKDKGKEKMKKRLSKKREKKIIEEGKEENLKEKENENIFEKEVTGTTETIEKSKSVIDKTKKMEKAAKVTSKMISKVGVKEGKEIGATFRLGRFGAQFFAPISRPPCDTATDDSDGEDVESEHSEDEEVRKIAN
ncbi:3-keto-steroid reductase [Dirofilaria immitis]